ncbi:MAG: ATP-binding cassette domain-containing protein [Candidatus Cloacimonetes bacterium]|nr:ATP-binding cassette domain-containing protein [Candidatus Cloacimonadota bacterium]
MSKEPVISVSNLIARYGEKTILDGISVNIYPEEITVILGGSGCGKTTLIKNILRLFEPYDGSVKIFGKEVVGMPEEQFDEILKHVGMLFQNGALLNSIPVFDNISIPLEQHTNLPYELRKRVILKKLNLVNLDHAVYLYPSELSGGMKKRAALARAMALDPEILVFDEPSAGLDPLTSASLDELILKLRDQLNVSVLVVTHELASIHRIADRIIFLEAGKLLFHGTLEEAKNCKIDSVIEFFEVGTF